MEQRYVSMGPVLGFNRRVFVRGCSVVVGGLVLGVPAAGADERATPTAAPKPTARPTPPGRPETNVADFMKVPRGPHAIPGKFPGRVVEVRDTACLVDGKVDGAVVRRMVERGITRLTGHDLKRSFRLLFSHDDVVGLKVNPVGPPLMNTRLEVTDAVVGWLVDSGLPKKNIVIWDRFDTMLKDAGYTADRFPGVRIEALQTMDEEGNRWRDESGHHVSESSFDRSAYYFVKGVVGKGVRGYKDDEFYLNQHVFNGEYSYFGKLVTKRLTKIVNLPVFKNTGHGISMATKNLGYASICNTGRLHQPLFFDVCTEVLAAPWVRDRLVLNITDGIRGQYDGGPGLNTQFVYPHETLYFATDPFAADTVCHGQMVGKRKEMKVRVDEHPRYTEYLRYGQRLGLGVADPVKIEHVRVTS